MHWLRDNCLFILVIALALLFTGCNNEHKDYDEIYKIAVEDIYNQKEEQYYVFFYKDTCPYCDDVFDVINNYLKADNDIKLYVCDLSNKTRTIYLIEYSNNFATFVTIDGKITEVEGIKEYSNDNGIYNFVFEDDSKGKLAINGDKITIKSDNIKSVEIAFEETLSSEIKRTYNGENGQGIEGKFFVDGVSKSNELYIATVPSIILINNNTSTFVTSGRSKVLAMFENSVN